MDKIDHGLQDIAHMGTGDDMRVLNVLVEQVRRTSMPVSGNAVELGLPDPDLLDELGAELVQSTVNLL